MADIDPKDFRIGETGFSVLVQNITETIADTLLPAGDYVSDRIAPMTPFCPTGVGVIFTLAAGSTLTTATLSFWVSLDNDLSAAKYPLCALNVTAGTSAAEEAKPIGVVVTGSAGNTVTAFFNFMPSNDSSAAGGMMDLTAIAGIEVRTTIAGTSSAAGDALAITVVGRKAYRPYP